MAKRPYVDQDICIGCGTCVDLCPGVFRLNDDMLAEVHNAAGATEQEIQEAVDSCPVECIDWVKE